MSDPATPAKDKSPSLRARASCLVRRAVDVLDPSTGGRFYCFTTLVLLLYVSVRHLRTPAPQPSIIALPPAPPPGGQSDGGQSLLETGAGAAAKAAVPAASFVDIAPVHPSESSEKNAAETSTASASDAAGAGTGHASVRAPSTSDSSRVGAAAVEAPALPPSVAASPPPPPKNTWQLKMGESCSSEHKGDSKVASCETVCNSKYAKGHCTRCKCRACDFCPKVEVDPMVLGGALAPLTAGDPLTPMNGAAVPASTVGDGTVVDARPAAVIGVGAVGASAASNPAVTVAGAATGASSGVADAMTVNATRAAVIAAAPSGNITSILSAA